MAPEYVFQADDGSETTKFYEYARAPRVGKVIHHRGKRYKRILSVLASSSHVTMGVAPEYSFVSHQVDPDLAPYVDPKTGSGAFRSKAEVKKWCDQSQHIADRGGLSWNIQGRQTREDRQKQVKEQRQAKRFRHEMKQLLKGEI